MKLWNNWIRGFANTGFAMALAGGLTLTFAPPLAAQEEQVSDRADEPEEEGAAQQEIRRGIEMQSTDGRSREQRSYERIISKVEPGIQGSPDRLDLYLELYKRELINDTNLFATNLTAEWDEAEEKVRLSGYVNYSQNHNALMRLFHYLGFEEVIDEVEVLPSESLGEERFGFVMGYTSFTYSAPEPPRETLNEALMGDPVFILREGEDNHYLIQTAEGYVGYIDGRDLVRVNAERFASYQSGEQAYFLTDYEDGHFMIPVGARLKVQERNLDGDNVIVELPDGFTVRAPSQVVAIRESEPNPAAIRALGVAEQLLGSRYVWGGKSLQGVDCSGLVQTAYKAQGINMPRDAYMQAYVGSIVATRDYPEGMRAGDLLYFLGGNGRITHTAMYMGEGIYIEASRGEVRYTSFNPEDENYDASRARGFAFAKRPLE